ncbi:MAG: hypothetical protein KME16_08710 [Scytolyngbya sp. HA4215-MV1]|nr:hypothetical protein [Scytolyngbya sp. HA4215-MV1]
MTIRPFDPARLPSSKKASASASASIAPPDPPTATRSEPLLRSPDSQPVPPPSTRQKPDRVPADTLTKPESPKREQERTVATASSQVPKQKPPLPWFAIWLGLIAFSGGTSAAAFLWLSTLPPLPDCQKLPPLAADADLLYCTEQQVRSDDLDSLRKGLDLIEPWSPDHPLYAKSQTLMAEWSKAVMEIARKKFNRNDLAGAIALAQEIPKNSPIHKEVEREIATWKKDSQRGKTLSTEIQAALKAQQWQQAISKAQDLSQLKGQTWQNALNVVRQQVNVERQARQTLQQARNLANLGTDPIKDLGQALVLLQQIDVKSYTYHDAKIAADHWSNALLKLAAERWSQKDVAGAIAATQEIPLNLPLSATTQERVWCTRAQQLIDAKQIVKTTLSHQFLTLSIVLPAIQRIQPQSQLYAQAQAQIPQLERQLQDLIQLQAAQTLAHQQGLATLQLAIRYAKSITADRPARLYAQSLIAKWQEEIQRIEDRPYLLTAKQLAQADTITQLQAAIAEASKIAPKRVLRIEAQTHIAYWKKQIQILEDKPILAQARVLANQGKLSKAIQTATQIRAGRALYSDAQIAIQGWTAQIQIAEDRPILDQANELAEQGSYTDAIRLADEIRPGRALYGEAQAAIARWIAAREAIYRERAEADNRDRTADPNGVAPPESTAPENAPPDPNPNGISADDFPTPKP